MNTYTKDLIMKPLTKHTMHNVTVVFVFFFASSAVGQHQEHSCNLNNKPIASSTHCKQVIISFENSKQKPNKKISSKIKRNKISTKTLLERQIKPLVPPPKSQTKGNRVYEFFAICNDKLQVFIANFDQSKNTHIAKITN